MIESRRQFLVPFFQALEANGVRYCVLRNYGDLYGNDATDLDLLLSEYSRERFERCLHAAADAAGWHFVLSARYVNHSRVFWHPRGGFLRVDYETEVRWRFFTVLTAQQVLNSRRREAEFFIPAPEVESVILYVAVTWRGQLSERYQRQLARLHAASDPAKLEQTLVEAFGHVGHELAEFQAAILQRTFDPAFSSRMRRSLMLTCHLHPDRLNVLVRNTWVDLRRWTERARRATGVAVLLVSSHAQPRNLQYLLERLNFLFPLKKNRLLESGGPVPERWTWQARWELRRTLFKGGLFLISRRVATDRELSREVRRQVGRLHPIRTFVCTEDSSGRVLLAHVGSGFMATAPPGGTLNDEAFSEFFIRLLSTVLERATARKSKARPRGLFCVLVGLDGSGKTTLARNLCELAGRDECSNGVRYFHWRPKFWRRTEFPLPESGNLPRKSPMRPSWVNTVFSAIRLGKYAVLVNLVWLLGVSRWLRRGRLILVDRYYYNYFIDPDSVKYSGPPGLLAWARRWFPKPDLVLHLQAPAEVLLARKQEVAPAELRRQVAALEALDFAASQVARLDAGATEAEVAAAAFREITKLLNRP